MCARRLRKVGFVGAGIMGSAIAGHILDAGYALTVHTRTKERADSLLARGATWAQTPAKAAEDADVVFTMVGFPEDVEDVYLGDAGILQAARKGAWLVDLTTSSPRLARDIHDAAEVMGKHAIDCPVTGGEEGAKAGTLTIMLGCTEREAALILPLLGTFSERVLYFEQPGGGQVAKLCNQVSLAACMAGYAEALALARESRLDVGRVRELVLSGTGASGAMERLAPLSLEGDFAPRFKSEHLRKDLSLALAQAEEVGLNLPETDTALSLFDLLCRVGGSSLGTQAVSLLYDGEEAGAAAGLDWSKLEEDEGGCECDGSCGGNCTCGHGGAAPQ